MAKLPYRKFSYGAKMFAAKMLVVEMLVAKMLKAKIPDFFHLVLQASNSGINFISILLCLKIRFLNSRVCIKTKTDHSSLLLL